jgi:hypothetical protein
VLAGVDDVIVAVNKLLLLLLLLLLLSLLLPLSLPIGVYEGAAFVTVQ